jgi:hypothetical protein
MLHIGAPKSGSSAIQRFCMHHRAEIEQLGYYYPEHSLDVNGVSGGHTQVAGPVLSGEMAQAEQKLIGWLHEARQRNACLLLSGEAFYGQAQNVRKLTPGLDVHVVAFLRHPVDYLLGNHNQGIKRHMHTKRLTELLLEQAGKPAPHLAGVPLLTWADVFGDANCHFLPYRTPVAGQASIEQRFLQTLGMTESNARQLAGEVVITNRSYVKSALELKRLLNTVLPELPDAQVNRVDWAMQGYSDKAHTEHSYTQADIPEPVRHQLLEQLMPQMQPVIQRFPALAEVGDLPLEPDSKLSKKQCVVDLTRPLNFMSETEPEVMAAIRTAAIALRDQGRQDYSFLKLLDLLGIEFAEPVRPDNALTDSVRKLLVSDKAQNADILREMAVMLERLNYLDDAFFVIEEALKRRPQGMGIQAIKKRISEKIITRKALLQ